MTPMKRLRVLTFNLLSPDHADWPSRRVPIRAELHRLQPDLVALQECVLRAGYDQVSDVLGEPYEVVQHSASVQRWPVGGPWAKSGRSTCTSPHA